MVRPLLVKEREWFQRFKNGDFDAEDRHSGGREKIFEDAELEALLDQDSCQNQKELERSLGVTQPAISKRLKTMEMIQKQGNWVPYELKPRDVEWRVCLRVCLLVNGCLKGKEQKGFLHRIVTGDEKWVHYDNQVQKIMGSLSRALKDKRPLYNERHDNMIEVARVYRTWQYKRWLDSLFFGRQRCTGQPLVVGGETVAPVTLGVCFFLLVPPVLPPLATLPPPLYAFLTAGPSLEPPPSDLRPVSLEKGQETLRLRVYACYAWGGPFLVAGLAALLDHLPPQPQYTFLRPRFGEKQCWFYGDMEILAYFFGPIGVLLAVNLMFFAVTARELTCGLWKGEFVKSTTERATLGRICMKLVIVMGITWVADVVSWAVGGPQYIWYFTDLINAFQGVLIFAAVGCQPQVRAALKRFVSRNPQTNAGRQGNGHSTTSHGMPSMGDSVTQNPSTKTAPLETIC
ncbi:MTH1 protein, partial [Pseudoatta argentina]